MATFLRKSNLTREKIEELILLVSRNESLFNITCKSYRDKQKTENIWRDIGAKLKLSRKFSHY